MKKTNVFIGGSRNGTEFGRLPKSVLKSISNIMEKSYCVLVGDANGVDKAAQIYLAKKKYKNVEVFVSGAEPVRNRADLEWKVSRVGQDSLLKGRELREQKDVAMADEADYGLMVWDDVYINRFGKESVSSGTLSNIVNLLNRSKKVAVFYRPNEKFYELSSIRQLEEALLPKTHDKTRLYYEKNIKKSTARKRPPTTPQLELIAREELDS